MLTVLFNWVYIFLTTFCLGQGFAYAVEKKLNYQIKKMDSILTAGLIITTVYSQIFSIFYKVELLANIFMLTVCILIMIVLRKRIGQIIMTGFKECRISRKVVILVLIVLWSYFTSRGYMAYDSDLYHGQSIRWIEEYGVVKGLGNLHIRFAYNSSVFALSALYSMRFLMGQSLHTINGFFALVLSITVLDIADTWKRKKLPLSGYARAAAVYYLAVICDEVVSPSSDYAAMCMIFFIIIKWLDSLESKEENDAVSPYALLCVCGVYALTLKLTAGLILILVIKPAITLIREKRFKEIALYIAMGIITAVPWLVRTVIISGWLLYPFPQLDLFSVDWKISAQKAATDAAEIKVWGRGLYDAALADMPVTRWFPGWFSTMLSASGKLLILADIVSAAILILTLFFTVIKKKWQRLDYLLVLTAVLFSYLYWQFSAPLLRYGYAYVLLLAVLTLGWVILELKKDKIIYFLLLVYGGYKLCMLIFYIYEVRLLPNYLWQKDYETYDVQAYEIAGETFYYPIYGDRVGYDYFPAAPEKMELEFRGDGIKDGFRLLY
ncbi:MAG: hypothetical protein K2N85_01995 [Lachnospiraceae bacterium]|nr:hypothetical protein [Lachnospiraceae bacterium]